MDFKFLEEQVKAQEERIKKLEQQQMMDRIYNAINHSSIPTGYVRGFSTYICDIPARKKFLEQVKNTFNDDFVTICLLGGYGVGKTHLACSYLTEAVYKKRKTINYAKDYGLVGYDDEDIRPWSVKYSLCDQICENYRAAQNFSSKTKPSDIINEFISCDIVCIDEIGRSINNKDEQEILYKIINERTLRKKTTILISNFNFSEFSNYIGGACTDRLKISGKFPDCSNIPSFRGK